MRYTTPWSTRSCGGRARRHVGRRRAHGRSLSERKSASLDAGEGSFRAYCCLSFEMETHLEPELGGPRYTLVRRMIYSHRSEPPLTLLRSYKVTHSPLMSRHGFGIVN